MVRAACGGLNFADFMTTQGGYPGTPAPPLIAGREFAGVEETSQRRVMGYIQWGAFAEKVAAYSNLLWPVPKHWSDEQAAAFPVNYFTAYLGYWQAGMTQPPAVGRTHRALIHAVAGGVGTAAVKIGRILGVEMYGTSSSDEKLARVKELGLQNGINYKRQDYEEVVKNLTRGEGVDAVFEMLGGEHTAKSLRCLRDFGIRRLLNHYFSDFISGRKFNRVEVKPLLCADVESVEEVSGCFRSNGSGNAS